MIKILLILCLSSHLLTPAVAEPHKQWKPVGCVSARFLPFPITPSKTNNLMECSDRCKDHGFSHAGVSEKHCQCGNDPLPDYGKVDKSECSLSCPGNQNKLCGGILKISVKDVYKTFTHKRLGVRTLAQNAQAGQLCR